MVMDWTCNDCGFAGGRWGVNKRESSAWLKGYGAALAALATTHGKPHLARMVAECDGLKWDDFARLRLTEYDRAGLRSVFDRDVLKGEV